MPIAIFYHCLFVGGTPPDLLPNSFPVVHEQMHTLLNSGLMQHTAHFIVGLNGGDESMDFAKLVFPKYASIICHGLASRSENLTLVALHNWCQVNPGFHVLYFHCKGATHDPTASYSAFAATWRRTMMRYLVENWRTCVADLDAGADSVGCHFMRNMGADHSQNIWAGNFWWAKSDFLAGLPSMFQRARIKLSGIASLESRYEAEVWIGNGKRLPVVKEYLPIGGEGVP